MRRSMVFFLAAALLLTAVFNASAKASNFAGISDDGKEIIVEKPFKRIISLYGAHTENLFSLGLDQEIIGVSENEAYPPQAIAKPVFSYHDDAEKFLAARPDLVLIRPMIAQGYKNLILKIQKAGITVVSLQPKTIGEVYSYWRDLGRLTGREREAERMMEQFQAGILKVNSLIKAIPLSGRKKVYFGPKKLKF